MYTLGATLTPMYVLNTNETLANSNIQNSEFKDYVIGPTSDTNITSVHLLIFGKNKSLKVYVAYF